MQGLGAHADNRRFLEATIAMRRNSRPEALFHHTRTGFVSTLNSTKLNHAGVLTTLHAFEEQLTIDELKNIESCNSDSVSLPMVHVYHAG